MILQVQSYLCVPEQPIGMFQWPESRNVKASTVSLREQLRTLMSSDLRSLETGIPRLVLQLLPWVCRRLGFLRVSCLWSYGSCHYQGRELSCQKDQGCLLSYQLSSRHSCLLRDPPDPCPPLLPSNSPSLAYSPYPSLSSTWVFILH